MKNKLCVLFILFVLAPCFAIETDTASFVISAYKNTTVTPENLVYNIYVENLYEDSQTGLIESGGSAEQPSEGNIISVSASTAKDMTDYFKVVYQANMLYPVQIYIKTGAWKDMAGSEYKVSYKATPALSFSSPELAAKFKESVESNSSIDVVDKNNSGGLEKTFKFIKDKSQKYEILKDSAGNTGFVEYSITYSAQAENDFDLTKSYEMTVMVEVGVDL